MYIPKLGDWFKSDELPGYFMAIIASSYNNSFYAYRPTAGWIFKLGMFDFAPYKTVAKIEYFNEKGMWYFEDDLCTPAPETLAILPDNTEHIIYAPAEIDLPVYVNNQLMKIEEMSVDKKRVWVELI